MSNPFKVPTEILAAKLERRNQWYYSSIVPIFEKAFRLGIILVALGSLISFIPGVEASWFGFTAIFIALGLFLPGYRYKITAFLLLFFCLFQTYNGYLRGIEYQELLKTRLNFVDALDVIPF